MSVTALFVGDVSLDLTMVISHVPAPDEKVHADYATEAVGGVVANAAVACANSGMRTRGAFQLGSDQAASTVEAELTDRGLTLNLSVAKGRTCRVVVLVEPHGEKRLLLDPGVSMFPDRQTIEKIPLENVKWVHTAVYGEAADLLIARCRDRGIAWSLDLEPASFLNGIDTIAQMIDGAEVIFCNDRASEAIGEDAVHLLLGLGAKAVVRTLGSQGAKMYVNGEVATARPPENMKIVDTTGAGDCLAGWFVGERLSGRSPADALRASVIAATMSCGALGAQGSYPMKSTVEGVLNRTSAPSLNDEDV